MKKSFLYLFLFLYNSVVLAEVELNSAANFQGTYMIITPEGQYVTLYIELYQDVTLNEHRYWQYSGHYENSQYIESFIFLRQDGTKYFSYDTQTNTEHLLFDFGLEKGDTYTNSFNSTKYDVTDVRDTLANGKSLRLIELQSQGNEGKHDIWMEGVGSIYTGIMQPNDYCKEIYLLTCPRYYTTGDEYDMDYFYYYFFYPNDQYIKTADMNLTEIVWEGGKIETEEDWVAYQEWQHAPTDLNAEFIGDTLHVWGRLRTSCVIQPYAACELKDNTITFITYSLGDVDCINNHKIETRIPGFEKGIYMVSLLNKTIELECTGEESAHQPLPLLEGNPIWVYKYEHIPMPRVPDLKCWVDTGDRSFTYYFLGGQKEIDGKFYRMMGEVISDKEGEITLNHWLPVREENGIVYAITDSLPGVVETEDNYDARYNDDYPMPYLKQGNECVLYNFSTDIGETLYPQNEGSTVKSIDTYQLLDGTECRVLKTQWAKYDLYEKLGFLNADPDFGIMDPFIGWPVSLNGHIYLNILNAYYQDNIMLYKAPDARDGLCVNDTCWTRDDAEAYARSYKADPHQEEVFSYIRQLQKASNYNDETAEEYFPEGTRWTEIRLDTLKYDSWYSKVGDEWVPNFETIEYYVQGEDTAWDEVYKKVYTNGPEWTDSLAFLLFESGHSVGTAVIDDDYVMYPGATYQFDWSIGMRLWFQDILNANATCFPPCGLYNYGMIDEIKEGDFGGVRPLKYVDLTGKAPIDSEQPWLHYGDTKGGRIIQGIGITEWNDGECLFGPPNPYCALTWSYEDRHYRSMLVHFERDGEVLYDVWPEKEAIEVEPVTFTRDQMATIILPTEPDASKGKYYRLDRCEKVEGQAKGRIIFERELQPQAHVPYIIVPSEDFSIDPSTLDLAGLSPDTVSIEGISFIGTYGRKELNEQEGFYIDIIDTTPDCTPLLGEGQGERLFIGALRAYLAVDKNAQLPWNDPYNQGGTKGLDGRMEIVLHDDGTDGIKNKELRMKNDGEWYSLDGRKIINGKLPRGINIIRMSNGMTRKMIEK